MNLVVVLVGWLIVAVGLLGVVRPHFAMEWIFAIPVGIRFYLIVIMRFLLGGFLILAAPGCRLPRFFYVAGVIILLAALALFFFGPLRLEAIMQQVSSLPNSIIRLLYVLTVLFGGVMVYAGTGSTRK
jgi:hypothetical protein